MVFGGDVGGEELQLRAVNVAGLDRDILALQDALREERKKTARLVLHRWKNRCCEARVLFTKIASFTPGRSDGF